MKRVALFASLILLTACSTSSSYVKGEVINCSTIQQAKPRIGGTSLDCLDRSEGVQLEALRGPMIVNVWGSWCGPCVKEIPHFVSFYKKAAGKVQLIGVDVEEANFDDGRRFVERHGITWSNLYDPDGRTRKYFGLGVPVTWFIAADGTVAYKHIGPIKNDLELISFTSKYLGVKL